MSDREKKPSVGETVATIAIAVGLTFMLWKIKRAAWAWATANRKRAWICVPILLWPVFFPFAVLVVGIILMSAGLLTSSLEDSIHEPTYQQKFWATFHVIAATAEGRKRGIRARMPTEPRSANGFREADFTLDAQPPAGCPGPTPIWTFLRPQQPSRFPPLRTAATE